MQKGNLTIKIVKSNNPQTKGMLRTNTSYNSNPTYNNSAYKSGDVIEAELIDNINIINRVINHDNIKIKIATEGKSKRPIISRDTIDYISCFYDVIID